MWVTSGLLCGSVGQVGQQVWSTFNPAAHNEAAKVNKKDLEKSRWNETGLAISYRSKKTAAA